MDQRTKIVGAVLTNLKLPPRFRLKLVKEDPIRLELSITPAYGKDPILVGLVESQDLVARRDREGRIPRDAFPAQAAAPGYQVTPTPMMSRDGGDPC